MNLTVFGATGGVGREVVTQALDAGHHVTAYVRSPAKLNLTHACTLADPGDVRAGRLALRALPRRRRDRHQSGRSSPSSSSPS